MSIARLLRDQGKRDEAGDLLSATKALLDELRGNHFEIEVLRSAQSSCHLAVN